MAIVGSDIGATSGWKNFPSMVPCSAPLVRSMHEEIEGEKQIRNLIQMGGRDLLCLSAEHIKKGIKSHLGSFNHSITLPYRQSRH